MNYIVKEDFSDFDIEEFPYDHEHSALGEYHHYMPKGYTGDFYDPICNHQWRSQGGSWLIVEANSKHYLEQNRGDYTKDHFISVSSILMHKKILYAFYTLEYEIMPLSTKELQGVVFNYVHNKKYDSLSFNNNILRLYHRDQETVTIYKEIPFNFEAMKSYQIKIEVSNLVRVFINNKKMLESNAPFIPSRVGFISKCATRYSYLYVTMTNENFNLQLSHEISLKNDLDKKRSNYSEIECIKKINLKNFGSGRQLRFANVDGKKIFLLAQHQKRIMRDSFARLSCLTAFDYDGNVLWQKGKPNNDFEHTFISCDLPFQIADVNGDSRLEVIYAMDFMVYVVDLLTGKELKTMRTPKVLGDPNVTKYPFDYLNPDGMRVADFQGLGYKGDFILKDRYSNVWAYNLETEKLLFRYHHKNTGHFPYICDMDNDGKDELIIGYDYVDHDGRIMWSLPIDSDHTDEIIYLATKKNGEKRYYLASGNEGFNIVNQKGEIIKSNQVGHAQRISIARYDLNREDLLVAVTSFWGANQIIYLFDGDGNLLKERETEENGNMVSPMNYDGLHSLILSNVSKTGGLLDSDLDPVVAFPEDNHPTESVEVLDIDCDGVDELICWNTHEMWIYKAKKYVTGNHFEKYPWDAFSNYRGEYLVKID